MLLEAQHPWSDSIGQQNYERLLPIKRIVRLLQIYIDLIEQALIAPGYALSKLRLNRGPHRSLSRKPTVEAIMELDWR
jgi:hypothetical protein